MEALTDPFVGFGGFTGFGVLAGLGMAIVLVGAVETSTDSQTICQLVGQVASGVKRPGLKPFRSSITDS